MTRAQRIVAVALTVAVLLLVTTGTAYAATIAARYELVDQAHAVAPVLLVGLLLALLVGQLVMVPAIMRRAARRPGRFFPAGHPTDSPPCPFSLSPDSARPGPTRAGVAR